MGCLGLFLEGFYCDLGTLLIGNNLWGLELSFGWNLARKTGFTKACSDRILLCRDTGFLNSSLCY